MLENVKKIIGFPLEDEKIRKFICICENIYTKEYLGTDLFGADPAYDEQLTTIATAYEISVFYLPERKTELRELMLEKMKEVDVKHPSKLFIV